MTSLEVAYDPRTHLPAVLEVSPGALAAEHDRRWTDWIDKGRMQDDRMRRQMGWVAGLAVALLASWALWTLAV